METTMKIQQLFLTTLLTGGILVGCGGSANDTNNAAPDDNLSVRLELPDSLTGGTAANNKGIAAKIGQVAVAGRGGTGEPCAFIGPEDDNDPFRNGYDTTRFLVSTMATWTCVADLLIDLADVIAHDGIIVESDNDTLASDYESDDPTHYSITDDSDTQVTVRMYYGYDRANPPVPTDIPDFYVSWSQTSDDIVQGRMIINANGINGANQNSDDPALMRMDFDFDADQRSADMFLQFNGDNQWAEGFRIQITKDLNASPLAQVFTARGLIKMAGQFFPVPGITETPNIQFYTVSDLLGNGAAIEEVQDFSLPLLLNFFLDNHLGNYLFTKTDLYFFEGDQDWEYIYKTVTSSEYRDGRNTPATGGSWLPFDPSLDMIINALSLANSYFTGNQCAIIGDDCNDLLNAVFLDGFAGQEQNQGSDPMDWRSDALNNANYLSSIYPNDIDWDGAFDQSFTPTP